LGNKKDRSEAKARVGDKINERNKREDEVWEEANKTNR
jgi:hypothetical protein